MRTGRLSAFLLNPIVDKILAFITMIPLFNYVYTISHEVLIGSIPFFSIYLLAMSNAIAELVFFLTRRTASRVSLNPTYWFVTLIRNLWFYTYFTLPTVGVGVQVLPLVATRLLLGVSVVWLLWGRLSLGRNIGSVPAERQIVTDGAYAFVRHPIHTASILFVGSFLLDRWSITNVAIFAVGAGFVLYKSIIEERFLSENPFYRAYCKRVPYRWIPYVI